MGPEGPEGSGRARGATLKTTRHGRASARHRTPPRGVELAAALGLGGLVSAHLSGAISADLG